MILFKNKRRLLLIGIPLVCIAILLVWFAGRSFLKNNHVGIETNKEIDVTAQVVKSMKDIGEWEFLSITDEELVDTTRKAFLGTDQLVRIYYGTLRLGINMKKVKPGWIKGNKDSVTVTLPKVGILDEEFINEARTRSFYESGKWTDDDRRKLYEKAYRQMKAACFTSDNIKSAEENAKNEFRSMLTALGVKNITINFEQ